MLLPDVPPSDDQGGVKGVPGGQGRYLRGPMEATGIPLMIYSAVKVI